MAGDGIHARDDLVNGGVISLNCVAAFSYFLYSFFSSWVCMCAYDSVCAYIAII